MANRRVKKVKDVEVIHKIEYRTTPVWISLATSDTDKPDIQELHSIIKYNLQLIQSLTGFTHEQVLNEIWKDIKSDIKQRHKFILDTTSDEGIRDIYKVPNDPFRRYK